MYRLQSTSNQNNKSQLLEQQEAFIASLKVQPLIVVCRPNQDDLEASKSDRPILSMLDHLNTAGVKHVEIAWSSHPGWKPLIEEIKACFSNFSLGGASITTPEALRSLSELSISYAMVPFWDQSLQSLAQELNQMLIPGVYSPSEIQQACHFGCRIVKLFPASSLGIDYWSQIKAPLGALPFVIAAGGLYASDLEAWLSKGYDAIAIGRQLIKNNQIDSALLAWLIAQQNKT